MSYCVVTTDVLVFYLEDEEAHAEPVLFRCLSVRPWEQSCAGSEQRAGKLPVTPAPRPQQRGTDLFLDGRGERSPQKSGLGTFPGSDALITLQCFFVIVMHFDGALRLP